MSSSTEDDAEHKFSCRCLNITINTAFSNSHPPEQTDTDYLPAFVGDQGICIIHHFLSLRTRSRAHRSNKSPDKLVQALIISCLACNTLVYRVAQEIPPEAEAREGPVVPTEDWLEKETLRSKSGWIEVFVGTNGCLAGRHAIEQHARSTHFSETFSIAVLAPTSDSKSGTTSSPSENFTHQSSDHPKTSPIQSQILPSLPPLLHPPPFTPSHPVFISLSARASQKSAELRARAEDNCKLFVQSQLDSLEKEEDQLRRDVEGIWKGFREGWKESLGKFKEERRLSLTAKPERLAHATGGKSGIPLSIREFSPIHQSQPQPPQSTEAQSQVLLPSLLSTSLAQRGSHFPVMASQSSEKDAVTSEPNVHSSHSHPLKPSTLLLQRANGTHSSGSSSTSIRSNSDAKMPGAFKRNMDSSVDIASSLAWAKGEEEMRRRLGGRESDPTERARNRTSKNLGIGAVEKNANPKLTPPREESIVGNNKVIEVSDNAPVTMSDQIDKAETTEPEADGRVQSPHSRSNTTPLAESGTKRNKRKVTFDVNPDGIRVTPHVPEARGIVPEVELFDLDDASSTEPSIDIGANLRPLRAVPRTPSYKLHANDSVLGQPASMPAHPVIPPLSPVNGTSRRSNGWRKYTDLTDALPLLSSSLPASDRLPTNRPLVSENSVRPLRTHSPPATLIPEKVEDRTPSPAPPKYSQDMYEPSEVQLKNLLAASAPSHRHAWKEGGKAWEMFHRRSAARGTAKGAIAEEDSDNEDVDDLSDEGEESDEQWRNPSQFASSLPIQIRPLARYKRSLEPKTSLADKQGVLVPPLKMVRRRPNSAAAFRKAAYAARDVIRSIDPGPALGLTDENDEDDYIPEDVGEGERGRRHALSILQASSELPEAGMWRSMAS